MAIILIINNTPDIREIFRYSLSTKHEVIEAMDGNQGIEFFELYKPDIIITDLNMHFMTGDAVIKYIRSVSKKVKIIACSGLLTSLTKCDEILQIGADLCLKPPVNWEKLLEVVDEFSDNPEEN